MNPTNKKKCVLGLAIILSLLIVTAIPLISPNNQSSFPLQANTFANTPIFNPITPISKDNPQPVDLWWNTSWCFRKEVNITEPGYVNRVNEPYELSGITFPSGHCHKNSIRVLYYNHITANWVEVPVQIQNPDPPSGDIITSCDLIFPVNVTAGGTSTYYVYYNDTYTGPPKTYSTPLSVSVVGNNSYFTFDTGVISGTYQIEYIVSDTDASFQIFRVGGVNLVPSSGLHRGIDRIDADDPGRDSYAVDNQLNWTAEIIENGPIRTTIKIYKTSTDKFLAAAGGGSYGTFNKTYTFYAYQGYVAIQTASPSGVDQIPIYDFAVIAVTSKWNFYVDNNNRGTATSIPFSDVKAGVQPLNYMVLVRNDGIGFGLLGSPQWPRDIMNGTSIEYGTNIDGGVSSFGIRNDDRASNEYKINVPFKYYAVGLTGGFDQAVNTWYQVNQPLSRNVGSEVRIFFPLKVTVNDNFGNPIPGANVNVYEDPALSLLNDTKSTNTQGQCIFTIFENYTTDQYWIQANVTGDYTPDTTYLSQAYRWNPFENFSEPISSLTINMNITRIYIEVWDNASHRVQNANVTLNYTSESLTNISQMVNQYFANCSFYAYANQLLNIDVYVGITKYDIENITILGTTQTVTQPINMDNPKAFKVYLKWNFGSTPSYLQCANGTQLLNIFWTDVVRFDVCLKNIRETCIEAQWMNFTIYNSLGQEVYSDTMNATGTPGRYYAQFNTSMISLLGGESYTIRVIAKPQLPNYQYPTPIDIFMPLKKLPVFPDFIPSVTTYWRQNLALYITIGGSYEDTHRSLPVTGATVRFTISGTGYVNWNMESWGAQGPGWYKIPNNVIDDLVPGKYDITITATLANYDIPLVNIPLTINSIPTKIVAPTTNLEGFFDENISVTIQFLHDVTSAGIVNANVTWTIRENTSVNGDLTDPWNLGNYTGQITAGTLPSGVYTVIIQATKTNYTTQFEYLTLDLKGTPTVLGSTLMVPQLFGSSEYLFAGPLIQVENSWYLIPVSFTYEDRNGTAVPDASITVSLNLPVYQFGEGWKKGVVEQDVHTLQVGSGIYLILVPSFGLPPGVYFMNIMASATNYQTQQIPIVLSIKEKAVPFGPWRIPLSMLFTIIAAIAIPTTAFGAYTFYRRARIPAIIKRIDELIKAISRGEKVTPRPILREKVVSAILSEELAIVGVEPRIEKYIPVELADLIVPLLVESGMKEKEAYALAIELKTAPPADKERLLESVGIPGETSARIIQMIEEYEERQEPFRKAPKRETPEEPEEPESEESGEESGEEQE
ncbi:MAG: hypothetical protein ACUVXA_10160 [Candidatus Jordarchaeum sp.]|uniref:hypothetical protein n=1 Tax=Candidatus Jordarchaeum sp. TaxID=2823881 RepID=UPI00404AF1A5